MARVEFNPGDKANKYPSNSNNHKAKEEAVAHPPVVKPVITSGASVRKKGIIAKVFGSFISEDVDDIGSYLFKDVIVPAVQDTLVNSIKDTADMLFYGEARSANNSRRRNNNYTVYSKGGKTQSTQSTQSRQQPTANNRAMHRFDSLEFDDYGSAKDVIDSLNDYIFEYESATVGTFYDFASVSHSWTDVSFGWYDVSMVKPRRIRNGNWVLDLPKPVPLK